MSGPDGTDTPDAAELGPDDLYPFEDRWAEIDGNLVHYVDEGAGPPLLLLNGNPSWSFGWRDVILGLRDRYRCVAPDYPGFGLSRAADGYDFRRGLALAVVEGWSTGSGSTGSSSSGTPGAGRSASASQVAGPSSFGGSSSRTPGPGRTTGCGPGSSGR